MGQAPLYTKMRPVSTHNKQISDFTTWNGLLVLAGLQSGFSNGDPRVYSSHDKQTALWMGELMSSGNLASRLE